MNDDTKHPTLIFIRGMPGSGKSYLAAALLQAYGPERVVMLDPDAIDLQGSAFTEFAKTAYAQEVEPNIRPFRYLKWQAFEGISAGKVLIWNQPFTDRGMFDRLVASLRDYAAERNIPLRALLVEVDIDPALSKERVQQRMQEGGHGPSERTLDRRIRDYISYAGGDYQTVPVDGAGDVSASVDIVRKAAEQEV